MKRKIAVLTILLGALLLPGCGISEMMMKKSGVSEDEKYQEYQSYLSEGKIDEEGHVIEVDEVQPQDSAHITFGNNNNLSVKYFSDAEKTDSSRINASECYLVSGESIYASVETDNILSSMYIFSGYNIYQYDDKGHRVLTDTIATSSDGLLLTIKDDDIGKEYSIEPVGSYQERQIRFSDYILEEDGTRKELDNTWIVNDVEYKSDSANISPIASYIISCEYDSSEYFFLSSIPESYYSNNEDGIVIFKQRDASDDTEDYSVELHKYLSVGIVSGQDRIVSVDGGDMQTVKEHTELKLEKLKYGQTVKITTNKTWDSLLSNNEIVFAEPIMSGNQYTYIGTIPEPGAEFMFDPSEYIFLHGQVGFRCMGSEITRPTKLLKGRVISYYQKSADDGYWLEDGNHQIEVTDEESTRKALEGVHFVEKVQVEVGLPQPDAGGSIVYYIDGQRIYSNSVKTYSGSIITMEFNNWTGWYANIEAAKEYKVTSNPTQEVSAGSVNIKTSLFTEDVEHKPILTVVLEKSVGEKMKFIFTATDLSTDKNQYESAWYRNDYTLIDKVQIGTDRGISVALSERAIEQGKAVRISIETKDKEGKKEAREPIYYEKLPISDELDIYKDGAAKSSVWYKEINIRVSVVPIEHFSSSLLSIENASIEVLRNDIGRLLSDGDVIENDTKVIYTIKAKSGYYISGAGVKDDIYSDTVNYKDFVNKIPKIIAEHPAKKIYSVTLDQSDSFASYKYKLDGREVEGTINIREGQDIELNYEIIDSSYNLVTPSGIWPFQDYKKTSGKIKFSADMAGKTIKAADFGIEAKKGE